MHEPLAVPAEYRPVLLRRKIQGQLAHVVGGGSPFLGAGFRSGQKLPGRLAMQGTGLAEAAGDGQVPQVLRRLLAGNGDGETQLHKPRQPGPEFNAQAVVPHVAGDGKDKGTQGVVPLLAGGKRTQVGAQREAAWRLDLFRRDPEACPRQPVRLRGNLFQAHQHAAVFHEESGRENP